MKKLMIQIMALLFTAFLGNNIQASATGFYGTEVVGAVYCCTVNDLIVELETSIVNNGDEFEVREQTGDTLVSAKIDISDTWINIDFTENTWSSAGDFNGYIFDFSPINSNDPFPAIESISLRYPDTTIDATLSFDADTILISLPSQRITSSSRILVDVIFVDDCVINYTINGPLNIPCFETDGILIESDMELSPWPSCDYLIVETDGDAAWDATMEAFKSIYNQECIILVVHSIITPIPTLRSAPITSNFNSEAWTIAGYNDNGIFISAQIDDLENELIVKLKDDLQNKSEVVKQLTSMLGRTPSYEPLAFTSTESRAIDSLSLNTDICIATSTSMTVTSTETLIISTLPCISVTDELGNIDKYQAVFEQVIDSEAIILNFNINFAQNLFARDLNIKLKDIETLQFTFKLIQAEKVD